MHRLCARGCVILMPQLSLEFCDTFQSPACQPQEVQCAAHSFCLLQPCPTVCFRCCGPEDRWELAPIQPCQQNWAIQQQPCWAAPHQLPRPQEVWARSRSPLCAPRPLMGSVLRPATLLERVRREQQDMGTWQPVRKALSSSRQLLVPKQPPRGQEVIQVWQWYVSLSASTPARALAHSCCSSCTSGTGLGA